jgi:Domain of unknown function (DUF6457)
MSLTTWTDQLVDALGIELEVDVEAILELARDAAHAVERPAAPLTTFLVGYAAGVRGGSVEDVADCIEIAVDLIESDAE